MIINRTSPSVKNNKRGMIGYVSIFIAVALIFISLGIYTGALLYTNYNDARTTMEQAMTNAVTEYMVSFELKDAYGNLETREIERLAMTSLANDFGWERQSEGNYALINGDRMVYRVSDVVFEGGGEDVIMKGKVHVQMPFQFMGELMFKADVSSQNTITFIERDT